MAETELGQPGHDLGPGKCLGQEYDLRIIPFDLCNEPFPEGEGFGMGVVHTEDMDPFLDPEKAIFEMRRVLKKDGRIVIGVLNRWSLWAFERRIKSLFTKTLFNNARFYSILELKRFFGKMKCKTTLFAPPHTPSFLLKYFERFEGTLSKIFRPFGAFVVCRFSSS